MNQHYKFVNTPPPYSYNAMESCIGEKTMYLHYDKHLQTYTDNLNNALSRYPEFQTRTLEQLLVNIPSLSTAPQTVVTSNGGGVFSRQFYFSDLTNPASSQPVGLFAESINMEFGSFQDLQNQLKTVALSVSGSGYAWLVVDAVGQLAVVTTESQDTPPPLGMCPVLNLDVWEHVYYLKHYNLRGDYINGWFHVVN